MIKEFANILINKDATVKEALKKLDKNIEKILFVINDNNKLIGSLTDGDIRRWILCDGKLDNSVEAACFKNTYYGKENYDVEAIKNEMKERDIQYVPIINNKREIIEFLVWQKLFNHTFKKKKIGKLDAAIIVMAGGKGTRLDPFTRILPKPLVPIGDKSVLEIIIEKFLEYNIDTFYISVNHKARLIKSYFEEIKPFYKIVYLEEEMPLGTIGALKQLEGKIEKEVLLTNCDIIIDTDYLDLLKHHRSNENDITIVASLKHYNIPYGICEIENGGRLKNIREKPEFDFLVNTGMYIINSNLLKFIPENRLFNATDLVERAIDEKKKVGIFPISENSWIDTGEWVEYRKAIEKLKL